MKLEILSKPNILKESALLIGNAISHNKGEKIKLLNEPEKYGLTELDLYERYGDFIEYTLDIYDAVRDKIDELEVLHPYLSLNKYSDYLSQLIVLSGMNKLEDLNFKNFKEGTLRALLSMGVVDGSKDLDELNKEAKELVLSDIDLGQILNILDHMILSDIDFTIEDKYTFLNFFNNLEQIYPAYSELLEFSHKIYIENYPRVEKYVEKSLDKLKANGEYPSDSNEIGIAQFVEMDGIREKKDDMFYLYISTILYNGLSVTASTDISIPVVGIEGILFYELKNLKEDEEFKFGDIKEQLKALGDSTRFNIINILNDKPHYLKELADALKLTSPTVSHHMDELLAAGLVKIKANGRRIYYSLNIESMKNISEFFNKYQEVQ